MSVSAVKSRLSMAREHVEKERPEDAEPLLQQAEGFLAALTDDEKAPLVAQIAELRALAAALPTPEQKRALSAAKGKLRQAQSQIDQGYDRNYVEESLATAEKHLADARAADRAPLDAEIAALRAKLAPPAAAAAPAPAPAPAPVAAPAPATVAAAPAPAPAPAPPAAAAPAKAALSDEDASKLSRARSRLMFAREYATSGRDAESTLQEALELLANVPADHAAPLLAQVEDIRREAATAQAAERTRRVDEELGRHLRSADSDVQYGRYRVENTLEKVAQRLGEDDVTSALTPAAIDAYKERIVAIRARLAAATKDEAIHRATPLLDDLEGQVAQDPFAGLDQMEAYRAHSGIASLAQRVRGAISDVPADDPDVKAIRARLAAVDAALDRASAAWGKAQLDASVDRSWSSIVTVIAGWEAEVAPHSRLGSPALPLTRTAISRTVSLLADPETVRIRAEHAGDPTIDATYLEAERVRAAAAAKLAAAFDAVLADAETFETPMSRFDLDRPPLLAYDAEQALAGTSAQAAVVTRARALDARWKAEVAAIMQARQELYDKLAIEADAAWPAIVERIAPARGVALAEIRPGTTLLLEGIRNRAGWDFVGSDFSLRYDGVPIGGDYAEHVLAALKHVWYELKLDVGSHIEWDVVVVFEGRGKLGQRTQVRLIDKDTRLEIGKIEEWPEVDALTLRVIALHAGPVAVGPQ